MKKMLRTFAILLAALAAGAGALPAAARAPMGLQVRGGGTVVADNAVVACYRLTNANAVAH